MRSWGFATENFIWVTTMNINTYIFRISNPNSCGDFVCEVGGLYKYNLLAGRH